MQNNKKQTEARKKIQIQLLRKYFETFFKRSLPSAQVIRPKIE